MKKAISIVDNEEGSVMVLALVILVLLTILGISSMNTSSVESLIIINDRLYRQSFYKAEGGAFEAAQEIKNDAKTIPSNVNPNLAGPGAGLGYVYEETTTNLRDNTTIAALGAAAVTDPDNNTVKASVFSPGTTGGSMDITKSETILCDFETYGYNTASGGNVHVMIGFKTRVLYQ
jgi:Tfp pilus assembly protein PilX